MTIIELRMKDRGSAEVTVGNRTYAFNKDKHGRLTTLVENEAHVPIFLAVEHYALVEDDPLPIPAAAVAEPNPQTGPVPPLSVSPAVPSTEPPAPASSPGAEASSATATPGGAAPAPDAAPGTNAEAHAGATGTEAASPPPPKPKRKSPAKKPAAAEPPKTE